MTLGPVLTGSSNKWAEEDSLNHDVIPSSEYQQSLCLTVHWRPAGCSYMWEILDSFQSPSQTLETVPVWNLILIHLFGVNIFRKRNHS